MILLFSWAVAVWMVGKFATGWLALVGGGVPWWSYMALVQNFMVVQLRDLGAPWMVVTWSLAIEVQMYFLLPFVVRRLSSRALLIFCGATVIGAPLIRHAFIAVAENPFGPIFHTLARCDGIMIGLGLAVLVASPSFLGRCAANRGRLFVLSGLGVAAFLVLSWMAPNHLKFSFVFTPTVMSLATASCILSLLPSGGPLPPRSGVVEGLAFFGDISYFAYLFHLPVLYTLVMLKMNGPYVREAALMGVIGLGVLSCKYIEKPLIALGRSRGAFPAWRFQRIPAQGLSAVSTVEGVRSSGRIFGSGDAGK